VNYFFSSLECKHHDPPNLFIAFSSNIKRIVVTSSIYAALRFEAAPIVLTEADWGNLFIELVEKYGREASNEAKYAASKTLAEKGTVAFLRQ
jgi:nucleoside-diphosphate-sugar epimerase